MTQRQRKQRSITRNRLSLWLDDAHGEQSVELVLVGEPALNGLYLAVYGDDGQHFGDAVHARSLHGFLKEAYRRVHLEHMRRRRKSRMQK